MRKLVLFLVAMSLLCGMVFAESQNTTVKVTTSAGIVPTPALVDFGPVAQGAIGTAGNITLSPIDGANTNMHITVGVSGSPFTAGLMFGGILASTQVYDLNCNATSGACVYTPIVITPTLDVPKGFPASIQTGTITYLVTGLPPGP